MTKRLAAYPMATLFTAFMLPPARVSAQPAKITRANFAFIHYPAFADQHSTWRDLGYDAANNRVYIAVVGTCKDGPIIVG